MKKLFFALLLLPSLATAQAPEYTMETAVQTALKEHPALRGAQAQIEGAQARVSEAKAAKAPRVTASAGYTQFQEAPSFTVNPLGTLVFGEKDNPQAGLSVQLPLYTGGRLEGMAQQARSGVDAAQQNLARRRQQVARDAALSYFNVAKARGFVNVAQAQGRALQAQRDDIAKMLERGVTTKLDLLRAETALAGAQETLSKARNGEAVAIAALANAMGLAPDAEIKVAGAFGPNIELPASAAEAKSEALKNRPELRQLTAQLASARAGERVANSATRPSVSAFAQLDARRPTIMPETGNWSAGVAVSLSLFDGGAAAAAKAQARAQAAQIEAAQMELNNGIALQATAAWLDAKSAAERLITTEKAVASAEEGLRLARIGYGNGVNTITDLLAAQSESTRAQNDRVTAQFDVRAAETELRFALGREVVEASAKGN